MGYTNQTSNLGLPQWLGSDKPNWDIDLNAAFKKIDDNAGEVADDISELEGKHDSVIETITAMQSEITDVQNVNIVQGERLTDLETDNIANKASIQKLNSDVSGLTNDVQSITDTELPSITDDIDKVESQVELNTQNIASLQELKLTPYDYVIRDYMSQKHTFNNGTVTHSLTSTGTNTWTWILRNIPTGISKVEPADIIIIDDVCIFLNNSSNNTLLLNYDKVALIGKLNLALTSGVAYSSTFTIYGGLVGTGTTTLGSTTFTISSDSGTAKNIIQIARTGNTGSFGAVSIDISIHGIATLSGYTIK